MVSRYRHIPNPALRTQGRVNQETIDNLSLNFGDSDTGGADADDIEIRSRWRVLVNIDLPRAADAHLDWPVYLNHCFARILLDNAVGQFWRDVIEAPAWKIRPSPSCKRRLIWATPSYQAMQIFGL